MPSWSDLENFLRRDGWGMIRQNGRDKVYEKTLPSGEVLRTAVSKGTGEIGKGLVVYLVGGFAVTVWFS